MTAFRLQTFTPAEGLGGHRQSEAERRLETAREEAYRAGFVAGQAAATESHLDDETRLTAELVEAIGDACMTNEAARRHVTESLAPVLRALATAIARTAVALPMMRAAGWGRVINIASAHGLRASPFKSAYVAAKHGIVGLSKVVALETAREPITCNAICPGYVRTPLIDAQIPDTAREYGISEDEAVEKVILLKQPSKEFVTIEQVAGIATFLCSGAADQITGTTISADGGWSAQ